MDDIDVMQFDVERNENAHIRRVPNRKFVVLTCGRKNAGFSLVSGWGIR